MSRTRWYVVAGLAVVTATVVLLDVSGVIFEPAEDVVPAASVTVPEPGPAAPALVPASTAGLTVDEAARLRRAVRNALDDASLGPRVAAVVESPTGAALLSTDAGRASAPASTLKLLTALAVLDTLGPDAEVTTQVVAGDAPSSIVLVGAGDASLVSALPRPGEFPAASLSALARRTATTLRGSGVTAVRLGYDDTLFTGPAVAPSWEPTYVSSGVIAPVTALMTDQGLVDPASGSLARSADPAAAAAARFADLLAGRGVSVRGAVRPVEAPDAADPVAAVSSPPAAALVEHMLTDSDNQLAEALGRLAAVAQGAPASFDGAAATLVAVAEDHGADLAGATVLDASGLSRDDRVSADALVTTLSAAVVDPVYRPLTAGLPVAALTGTLLDRFLDPPSTVGAGLVRAKTGTLTGVSSEAGLVVTCEGELLAFAFLADQVPYDTEAARAALDRAAAVLASCSPGSGTTGSSGA